MELSELPGVGPKTLEKLTDAGIGSLMALAVTPPAEISSTAGISEAAARKLIKEARENLKLGFEKAKEYAKKRDVVEKIGTGCNNYDEILGGGFESGAITEIFGEFGSGKTQMCHLISVRALLENSTNKVIYIDTENTFRADRIKDFCEASGVDYEDAMERIWVARAYNSSHQILLIQEVAKMLQEDQTYRVIIVDSLTSHFRAEYIGRGTLANRQQLLNQHMHDLLKLADLYNLVVLVTNQVMAKPNQMYGDPTTAIGGHIVGHNCLDINTLIYHPNGLQCLGNFAHKLMDRKILTADKKGKITTSTSTNYKLDFKKTKKIYSYNIINATEEHRFPVLVDKNKMINKKVKDLEIGDMLLVPKKINMKGKLQELEWKYNSKYNNKKLKIPKHIDVSLSYLLGVILGDGNFDKRSLSITDRYEENLVKVNLIFETVFGIKGKITKRLFANAYRLRINSKEIKENLNIKENKSHFLEKISASPENIRIAFISGMVDTDGSFCREITISQKDKLVLDHIQGMLLMSGIHSVIREQINERGLSTGNFIYQLRVRSGHCGKLAKMLKTIYKKSGTLEKYLERKSKKFYKIREFGDFIAYPILNILDGPETNVIDMEVENTHLFIANGMLSHNSTFRIYMRPGKAGSKYVKLIDSPNLPIGETYVNITKDGFEDAKV